MKATKRFICVLMLFGALFSASVFAADRGLYRCDTGFCVTPKPFAPDARIDSLGEWLAFIKGTVNPTLNVQIWNTSDTVQVCNGETCITFIYRIGDWYTVSAEPDTGQKNRGDSVKRTRRTSLEGDTGCRGGTVYVANGSGGYLTGYTQWYDYYTNDVYTNSSPREFIPTGYSAGTGGTPAPTRCT
jgi:hypothetical protein